ncbi:hypothetical protein SASPL_126389 [Salvia splendens]|uniref:Protein EARLY RESPONSIVE TO DEHYDRATION 15 n=1 Tax=Salvia splendens TaxID=180675 RepID=A0A8X8XKE1_SALSN|nr:hypothetical protein SASPL_126389 [Salvia splendens]
MALVSGGKSSLNPYAPLFIPAAVQQVEDFSPEWWNLVTTATWFKDYWLNQHQGEDIFGEETDGNDVVGLLPDNFDLGIDEDTLNMEAQYEEFLQSAEGQNYHESKAAIGITDSGEKPPSNYSIIGFEQECDAGEDSEHAEGERLLVATRGDEVGEACKDCEPKVQPSIHPATSLRSKACRGWVCKPGDDGVNLELKAWRGDGVGGRVEERRAGAVVGLPEATAMATGVDGWMLEGGWTVQLVAAWSGGGEIRAASDGACEGEDLLGQIDDASGRSTQRIDHTRGLVESNRLERLHHPRAEKLVDADLPHLAPVVAVGAEGDVDVVVPHDLQGHARRSVGEAGMLILEDLLRDIRRRYLKRLLQLRDDRNWRVDMKLIILTELRSRCRGDLARHAAADFARLLRPLPLLLHVIHHVP